MQSHEIDGNTMVDDGDLEERKSALLAQAVLVAI